MAQFLSYRLTRAPYTELRKPQSLMLSSYTLILYAQLLT